VSEVGRTPSDLVLDASDETAITADSMSDTLTLIRVSDLSVIGTIALGPTPVRRTPAERGEAAFLDGRRSLDRWMSCASCHVNGHTNGLNFDTLGDGGFGAPKNTPSLLGVGPTAPFAWTGQFEALRDQVHQSLDSSLRGRSADDRTTDEITAYLETLAPPPPLRSPEDPAALRGAALFETNRCQACHRPPHYTSPGIKDVGLDDGPGGHRAFNPPSLRGAGWSAPYFHDGRARTLRDALRVHTPGVRTPLTPGECDDLVAFLESL
jgi:cytochrome c peroxidase